MLQSEKQFRNGIILSLFLSMTVMLIGYVLLRLFGLLPGEAPAGKKWLYVLSLAIGYSVFFLYFSRKYRRRKHLQKAPFPEEWERILTNRVDYYNTLGIEDRDRFRKMVRVFLGEKSISGIDTEVDDECRLLIAASAIIPVFRFPRWEYKRLGEVLVYPDNFDDAFRFDKKGGDILGMVMSDSVALIVSKPALYNGFAVGRDRKNVGIHEFIHKVDGEDGEIDGVPALLLDRKSVREWRLLMRWESTKIERGMSDISDYALTSDAEFFAVVGEYFFENPRAMEVKHPELYRFLKKIFRQDTGTMFTDIMESVLPVRKKKLRPDDFCPCGSGEKYKKCCLLK